MLKKYVKKIVGVSVLLIVLLLISFQLIISKKVNQTKTTPIPGKAQESNSVKPTTITPDKEYKDQAGFKFSYPGNLILSARPITDENTYSSLELISNKAKGNISFRIFDSTQKITAETSQGTSVTLADLAAKKIVTVNKITVLAREGNTLYLFESQPEKNKAFWLTALDKIVASFAFVNPANNNSSSSSSSDNSTSVEEEVVE